MRKEALDLLALWPAPPARDRIVGVYRPLAEKTRSTESAIAALAPKLGNLLAAHTPDTVQVSALDAVRTLELKDAAPQLRAVNHLRPRRRRRPTPRPGSPAPGG